MPDYAKLIRNMTAKANTMLQSLEGDVQHTSAVIGGDGVSYPGPVHVWRAVVSWRQKVVRTLQGQESVSRAEIQFLEPHDIDEHDLIILPDGTTGPILDLSGQVDPLTGRAFSATVWLG